MVTLASFYGVLPLSDTTRALFAQPSVSVHSFSYKPRFNTSTSVKLRSKSSYGGGGGVILRAYTSGVRLVAKDREESKEKDKSQSKNSNSLLPISNNKSNTTVPYPSHKLSQQHQSTHKNQK